MIAALIGVLAPFLPDFLGIARAWMDDRHERKMMDLRLQHAEKAHDWRMEELDLKVTASDRISARTESKKPGFGIQLLEASRHAEGVVSKWAFNVAFGLYTMVDWISATVRPTVTYWLVGLYGAIKLSTIYLLYQAEGSIATALQYDSVWTPFDSELLMLVIAFWFGGRLRHKAKSMVTP